jgi:hypothetical protein
MRYLGFDSRIFLLTRGEVIIKKYLATSWKDKSMERDVIMLKGPFVM